MQPSTEIKPFRWSFSQWENYAGCPRRWMYKSVMKLPSSPPGPAAARGLEMHDRAERYIKGELESIEAPGELRFGDKKAATIAEKYVHVLDDFKNHPNGERHTEFRMAFDDEWYLTGGYQSANTWCIAILDAVRGQHGVLNIGEWKSGKPKDTHVDQRKLYALAGFRRWLVDEVRVTTYYLEDTAPPDRLVVKATAEDKLKALWNGRVEQMQRDKICAPKPGVHCRWCDYAKAKGGPCAF